MRPAPSIRALQNNQMQRTGAAQGMDPRRRRHPGGVISSGHGGPGVWRRQTRPEVPAKPAVASTAAVQDNVR